MNETEVIDNAWFFLSRSVLLFVENAPIATTMIVISVVLSGYLWIRKSF